MRTYTGPTPSAQGLAKPADCVSSQQAQSHDYQAYCQKDGETGVVVHDGQHSPNLLKFFPRSSELEFTAEFHPVFPLFLRCRSRLTLRESTTAPFCAALHGRR